jgi:uncharacterized protein YggE
MRKSLILLALILSLCLAAAAQELDKTPQITVSGTADVMVQPDEVVLTLDVSKKDINLQVAKKQCDEAISKILELTRRFSVDPKNVRTDYISMDMKYEWIRDPKAARVYDEDGDEIGKKIFKGYEVSTTVIVRLTKIAQFEDFFSEALKTGVTEISKVKFETSKLRENKDKARDMALRAAKEKAAAMAASVGQTIGKAIKISEVSENQNYDNASLASNAVGYANTSSVTVSSSESLATFSPGTIKISAQVTVSFVLN